MDQVTAQKAGVEAISPFAPLKVRAYRNIWSASIFSNVGALVFGVGAAWEMTRMTDSPTMVALVQTFLMLPMFLVTVPAGAIADMFDKRKVAMFGLAFAAISASILTLIAVLGLLTPWLLLASCSIIGAGTALFIPAWQASIGDLVDRRRLPAAIALASISFNLGRSVGPALGGLVVLTFGAITSFGLNAVSYLPLLLMFALWKRTEMPSRLPPERIERAIVSGARYSFHSSTIRTAMIRIFATGVVGAGMAALAPLIARDVLNGTAATYGILLCSIGIGSVVSALLMGALTDRFGIEGSVRLLVVCAGIGTIAAGLSRTLPLTCLALFFAGGTYTLVISMMNISVQMSAPRWVVARALSLYAAAITGGVAIGAWFWGMIAGMTSISTAMILSGAGFVLLYLLARVLPLAELSHEGNDQVTLENEPEVGLHISMRSGPVVIAISYEVEMDDAREFYDAMRAVETTRLRNGAFNWSLSRDIGLPVRWVERFQFPTWGDYLRMRDRLTQSDIETQIAAETFLREGVEPVITRRLERPFGSVRWKSDSPDPEHEPPGFLPH